MGTIPNILTPSEQVFNSVEYPETSNPTKICIFDGYVNKQTKSVPSSQAVWVLGR